MIHSEVCPAASEGITSTESLCTITRVPTVFTRVDNVRGGLDTTMTLLWRLGRRPLQGTWAHYSCSKHYLEGNMVGSVVPEEEEGEYNSTGVSSSSSAPKKETRRVDSITRRTLFCDSLKMLFEDLLMEFNLKGADTRKFIEEKLKNLPVA